MAFLLICSMINEKATAEKLLQINAIKLSPQQPFTWASGWKSPIYCDNRKVLSFPFSRDFIKSEMCNVVFEQFPGADILAGVGTAGIPLGSNGIRSAEITLYLCTSKAKRTWNGQSN